jgi:2-polyprenyl-3-methyl-5-hydroxy-6-metoxy-1,4-benzoquinol methylase
MNFSSQTYWQSTWEESGTKDGFELFDDVAKHLPHVPGLDFFEIGCAPGGISAEFCARLGYVANGIDYAADPREIENRIRSKGAEVGEIHREDFLQWEPTRLYDIVASFGFIEHFEEPNEVVDRHFKLARPGGFVVITVPNFARGQKVLHWLFDRENLRLHNTKCMNLRFLKEAARRNKAQLIEARYAGGQYDFWVGGNHRLSWFNMRLMWRTTALLGRVAKSLPEGVNPWFSPFIIAVYRTSKEIG